MGVEKKDKEQTIGTFGNSSEESFEEETYSWERLTHRVVQVEHGVHFRRVPVHTWQGLSFDDFKYLKLTNSVYDFDVLTFWWFRFFSSHNVQFCHGHRTTSQNMLDSREVSEHVHSICEEGVPNESMSNKHLNKLQTC